MDADPGEKRKLNKIRIQAAILSFGSLAASI